MSSRLVKTELLYSIIVTLFNILCNKLFIFLITATDFSLERDLEELVSLIDIFTKCDRLQNAHGLYSTLMNRFPQVGELLLLCEFVIFILLFKQTKTF